MKSFFTTFKVFGICFLLNPMSPSSVFAETNDKSSDFPLENMGQNTVVSQKRLVTGVVLDSQGEPVVGANVFEKGEKPNGTITDKDGKFSLNVSDNATLVVSFVGFKNQEIAVKGRDKIDIRLADDSELLDEVVVVGYMTQKKGLVTGAVSSMKMDEKLNTLPTTSAGNILVGKLAGVSVSTPNGLPGAAPSISIRTGSSWNDQNVTYVIDGVVRGGGDFNNLSPNEIEDITVLKDAASAAIYGSRSAGGVIMGIVLIHVQRIQI